MIPHRQDGYYFLAIALAVLVFYSIWWRTAPVLDSDSHGYMKMAQELRALKLTKVHQRTIGLPLLLIATGADVHPTRLFFWTSLILHLITVGLLAYLLSVLKMNRRLVWLFAVTALLPPYVESAAWVMTEDLSEFAVAAAFCAFVLWVENARSRWLLCMIVAACLAALTRPTYILLGPLLGLTAVMSSTLRWLPSERLPKFKTSVALAFGVPFSLVIVCSSFNYVRFGYFGMSTMDAYVLNHKTASFVEFLPTTFSPLREILIKHRDQMLLTPYDDHTAQNYLYRALPEIYPLFNNDEIKSLNAVRRANMTLIAHKPMSFVNEGAKALATYWMPNDNVLANGSSPVLRGCWVLLQGGLLIAFFVQFLVLLGAMAICLSVTLLTGRKQTLIESNQQTTVTAYITGAAIVVYTAVTSSFFAIGSARYRVPTDALILVVTVMGYTMWVRILRRIMETTQGIDPARARTLAER